MSTELDYKELASQMSVVGTLKDKNYSYGLFAYKDTRVIMRENLTTGAVDFLDPEQLAEITQLIKLTGL